MSKTILVIDDEKKMLEFYQTVLSGFGQVRTALNLSEARAQLAGVDLIILDFVLEQDQELIQEIIPELKRVAPVLLCSGLQEPGVPAIGDQLGVDGYWNKGTDHEQLRALVGSVLAKQG